jgi:hypothetical protein
MLGNSPVGLNRGRVHREENVGLDYRWHREIPAPPGTRFPAQKVATIGRRVDYFSLHKGCCGSAFSFNADPQKKNSRLFLWVIFALLDPDQNSQCGPWSGSSRPKSIRIRIRNIAHKYLKFIPFVYSETQLKILPILTKKRRKESIKLHFSYIQVN